MEAIKNFLKNNMGYIAVAFVCAVYAMTSFIRIDDTGKTILQIILDGAITFFLGVTVNSILKMQGILKGEGCEIYQSTLLEHGKIVEKITPKIDKLEPWCEKMNAQALKNQRVKYLASVGLKYSNFFDEEGLCIYKFEKIKSTDKAEIKAEEKRRKYIKKAIRLKITHLSTNNLTTEGAKTQDPYYFGKTKIQYERESGAKDVISKIVVSLIFGYYGVEFVETFDMAELIWKVLQISLFIVFGTVSMFKAYFFIKDEYRAKIIKKVNYLEMFESESGKGDKTNESICIPKENT